MIAPEKKVLKIQNNERLILHIIKVISLISYVQDWNAQKMNYVLHSCV